MEKLFTILLILFATNLTAQLVLDIDIDDDGLIEVSNMETLNAIRYQSDGSGLRMSADAEKVTSGCAVGGCKGYELTRDLDFLDAASYKDITNLQLWTSGAGWQPIGDGEHPFNAVFKTNNSSTPHTIFNLRIHREDEDNVGLFGNIGDTAEISGIGLLDAEVVGRHQVGALVGENVGGRVSNSYASGQVVGTGGAVGLLIGSNSGAITNSYADGEVSGKDNSVGGLIGVNSGNISNSYAMGNVVGEANNVGGLVGDNSQGVISNSYASASVSGSEDIGGLVGLSNLGTLIKNYVSGKATGIRYVGGLVGMNIGGTVSYSYWDKTTSQLEGNSDGVGLSANDLQSASAQNDDLNKPFYQWSTADWDFGSDEQYPILKYATGIDAENPVCGPEFSLPNCGSLLLGQHASLKRILLLAEASLTPRFKPTRFNYHLNITSAIKQLQLIPIANNPNSVINISTTSTAIATDMASGTTSTAITLDSNTEITITVSASNQRPAHYRLTVNYLPTLTIGGIPSEAMDEGRLVILDAYQSIDAEGEALNYQWTQSVGKAIDIEATDQPILILRIPEDYVSEHATNAELGITVAVSDGKATASQDIHIDIRKIDNGTLTVAAPTPSATEWTAPKIDLAEDPDGVGSNLQYQWQSRAPSEDAEWTDIDRATQQTYTPSILTAIGTKYRVRIRYTDGQGYETKLLGNAATYQPEIVTLDFAKAQATDPDSTSTTPTTTTTEGSKCSPTVIDYDNDGLIDICDLEGLNAMRYQLDGSGYRASVYAEKITEGCPADICKGYELMRDLDFLEDASYRDPANKARWTIDDSLYREYKGWQPIGTDISAFNAIFEGNNHIISNLMIERFDVYYTGLFGFAESDTKIANIGLLNVDIKGRKAMGGLVGRGNDILITNSYVVGVIKGIEEIGGLVGYSVGGRITNSHMVGSVKGSYAAVGGLVGRGTDILITNSYVAGTVRGGNMHTGGLIGRSNGGSITNSYTVGTVAGWNHVGGLVGYSSDSRITNSYMASMVRGNNSEVGLADSGSSITNSYWNKDVSRTQRGVEGRGLTTQQLQSPTMATGIYSSWSTNDWDFGTEAEYPILKYARGFDSNNPACLDETTEESALQVCGELLSPAIRYGLEDLQLAEGNLSPDFLESVEHYVGTAVNTTSTIHLIPTALDQDATISIEANGTQINKGMMSGTTSSAISLNSESTTRITLAVANSGETTRTVEYTLYLKHHHYSGDVDDDDDGLIEIYHLEDLNAIRYQLDGSGYQEGSDKPKITMGCPEAGCTGYELEDNLDFWDENSYKEPSNRSLWTGKQSWQPLGDDLHAFTALFEGNNNTISNLKVYKLASRNLGLFGVTGTNAEILNIELSDVDVIGDYNVGGLVGINYGKIMNSRTIGKSSTAIVRRYGSGGLVGANDGDIINSYSTIRVMGKSEVAGLAGRNRGKIINSYATGNVYGVIQAGGLVGRNRVRSSITNSYALGDVLGGLAGGLVALNRGDITDSYAHNGLVKTEDQYVGGLVGHNERGTITRSYAVSQSIEANNERRAKGLVGRRNGGSVFYSYWDTETSGKNISSGGTGKTTANLQGPTKAVGIYSRWSTANWHFGSEKQYPTLKYTRGPYVDYPACLTTTDAKSELPKCGTEISMKGHPGLEQLTLVAGYLSPQFIPTTWKYKGAVVHNSNIIQLILTALDSKNKITIKVDGMDYSIESGATSEEITLNEDGTTTITLVVMTAQGKVPYELSLRYHKHTRNIDEDNDGLIEVRDFEDLDDMRHQLDGSGYREDSTAPKITVGCPNNDCKGYELMADLDFNKPGNYAVDKEKGWRPIGLRDNEFRTIFEGNGHTISNVWVNRPRVAGVGLFGHVLDGGFIRNIGMLDVEIKGSDHVGSLVGRNQGGRVMNSYAIGNVEGAEKTIGGLVGLNTGAGRIMNSYASVKVKGVKQVGGLAGVNTNAFIADSYATGSIEGTGTLGGLVSFENRYIVGEITNSYAIAKVSDGSSGVGGLIGRRVGNWITSSYWDKDTSGRSSSAGGEGKTTVQLQTPTTATGIYSSWDTAKWDFGTAQQYPALKYAAGTDTDNPACGRERQPTCGTLLPTQHPSLLDALAVKNNKLSPDFDPHTFDYDVEVNFDVDTLTLHTTATGASIRISSNLTPTEITDDNTVHTTMPLTIAAPTVITIEVTTPGQRPTPYQLHVTHNKGDPDDPLPTPQGRFGDKKKDDIGNNQIEVPEGQTFEVGFDKVGSEVNCSVKLKCEWNIPTALASFLDKDQSSTNNLIFMKVPANFVDSGKDTKELDLKFATRPRQGSGINEKIITVIIKKTNNSDISVGQLTLKGNSLTAPEIIWSDDTDGGVQKDTVTYQWQCAEVYDAASGKPDNWTDIAKTTTRTYTVTNNALCTAWYRVLINYTDGQGFCYGDIRREIQQCSNTDPIKPIPSSSIRDIDVDDDGLIEIKYLEELDAIRHQLDGTGYKENDDSATAKLTVGCPTNGCKGYELVADLDFTADESYLDTANRETWTTGDGWKPIGDVDYAFSGEFKGNGHTISNLTIDRDDLDHVGLFAYVTTGGVIDGVDLYKVNIRGQDRVGALVGTNDGGTITHISVDGIVSGINGNEIGGLVGLNEGSIKKSYSAARVIGESINSMGNYVGGLIGMNEGLVTDSYARGSVCGGSHVGGLVGRHREDKIINSYATSKVEDNSEEDSNAACEAEGNINVGGLVGSLHTGATITNSYWQTRDGFSPGNTHGDGLSAEQLQRPTTATTDIYSGWDTAVWDFGTSAQYPALKYRSDECSEANPPNYCGDLLAGQRLGFQTLRLSKAAMLLKDFSRDTYTYDVIAASGEKLQLIFAAAHPQAMIKVISDDDNTIEEFTGNQEQMVELGSEVKATTIHVIVNKRQTSYTLAVSRFSVDIDASVDGEIVTDHKFDEGDLVTLERKVDYEKEPDITPSYLWMHEQSDKNLLMGITTDTQSTFRIPATYVETGLSTTTTITLKVTLEQGGRSLTYSKEFNLTIIKKNNGSISAANIISAIGALMLNDSLLSVETEGLSEEVLSEDPDGVNQAPAIKYQWQRYISPRWGTVSETSPMSKYEVPVSVIRGTEYRVLISSTDGQGYESTATSSSITLTDVDRDNDGLIEVDTAEQLHAIRHRLNGSGYSSSGTTTITLGCPVDNGCKGYELKAHLDLDGMNWQPLGSSANPFNAIFKGNNHTISNLTINSTATDYVGLFAATTTSAEIYNVGLLNVEINANDNVGSLVGSNAGTIAHSHVGLLNVSITANKNVGGLVGSNAGTIAHSHVVGKRIEGNSAVGGLVGSNAGTIAHSHVVGKRIEGNSAVGGLVGNNTHKVTTSHAIVKEVIGRMRGDSDIGGLIGRSTEGVITHSYAKIDYMEVNGEDVCDDDEERDRLIDQLIGEDDRNLIIESKMAGGCKSQKVFERPPTSP